MTRFDSSTIRKGAGLARFSRWPSGPVLLSTYVVTFLPALSASSTVQFVLRLGGAVDRMPQLQQVVQVPLQFLGRAADARGARDDRHARRQLELVHGVAQFLPVLALDAARNAAAARVVRHQHEVAARQRNEGGQCRALVAALFLLDLDQQFLAFAQRLLDAGAADVDPFAEVGSGDFLERQEAVALLAVVDETRLEAGLDARDHAFVDVRLSLLAPRGLDVDVDQLLAVDDAHAQFLCMRGVEEHAFHQHSLRLLRGASRCRNGRAARAARFRSCGRRGDAQQRPRKAVFRIPGRLRAPSRPHRYRAT